ncbi:MAG TPA: MATE family efflux transporter [Candidatus Marinimicrobia bacterium]|nr:MATE family efflux transporter [Candidatus Neomarinimicrobiota bacterium]
MMKNKNHILADERIGRLLIKLSTPAMVAMFVMALYNIVDTIYIGRGVGPLAIAGITIVFPIQMIVMAIAMMLGIGSASIISRALGAKDYQKANKALGNIIVLVTGFGLLMATLGNIFLDDLLQIFGATGNILPYSRDYASIILYGTVFHSFAMASNNIIRSEGRAKIAMMTMLISAILNIILDPIFIFVLKMGVRGAALATVISQIATVIYLVYYFFTGKSSLKIRVGDLRLNKKIILETIAIGSASFFRQISGSILIIIMNNTLKVYGGDLSIAAFGIIHRLLMFVAMPIFGIAQGLQPIIGFNYGARRYDKVRRGLKLAIRASSIMGLCGTLILIAFTRPLLTIFTNNQELLDLGSNALRIYVLAFPLFGFQVIGSTLFQALGKAKQALGLTLGKQLFVILMVLVLPQLLQLNGVWLTFPITDVVFFFVTLAFYLPQMREFDAKIAKT